MTNKTKAELQSEIKELRARLAQLESDQSTAGQKLAESSAFTQQILDAAPIGLIIYDQTGQCVVANPASGDLVGATTEQLLSQNFNTLHSWQETGLAEAANTALQQGTAQKLEFNVTTTFGKKFWIDCHLVPFTAHGAPHLLVVFDDITPRKEMELALQDNQTRLEHIIDSSNTGIWEWHLPDNTVYFSPRWKEILGYTDAEIPNLFSEWEDRLHPDDYAPTTQALQNYLANPRGRLIVEFRMRHKDGSYRWILDHGAAVLNAQGEPVHLYGSHLDITERKASEEAMRRMTVSRQLVSQILHDLQKFSDLNEQVMFEAGQQMAKRVKAGSLTEFLAAYEDMGLGTLKIVEADSGLQRWIFTGDDLVETVRDGHQPGCNYTRGFLSEMISVLHDNRPVISTEMACQSMGDDHCKFVLQLV